MTKNVDFQKHFNKLKKQFHKDLKRGIGGKILSDFKALLKLCYQTEQLSQIEPIFYEPIHLLGKNSTTAMNLLIEKCPSEARKIFDALDFDSIYFKYFDLKIKSITPEYISHSLPHYLIYIQQCIRHNGLDNISFSKSFEDEIIAFASFYLNAINKDLPKHIDKHYYEPFRHSGESFNRFIAKYLEKAQSQQVIDFFFKDKEFITNPKIVEHIKTNPNIINNPKVAESPDLLRDMCTFFFTRNPDYRHINDLNNFDMEQFNHNKQTYSHFERTFKNFFDIEAPDLNRMVSKNSSNANEQPKKQTSQDEEPFYLFQDFLITKDQDLLMEIKPQNTGIFFEKIDLKHNDFIRILQKFEGVELYVDDAWFFLEKEHFTDEASMQRLCELVQKFINTGNQTSISIQKG